jgi:hypothetical protein
MTTNTPNPKPFMSQWGFMLYPVYNQKGQLVYVSIPEREAN